MVHSLKEAETRETLRRCHANQQREALLPAAWTKPPANSYNVFLLFNLEAAWDEGHCILALGPVGGPLQTYSYYRHSSQLEAPGINCKAYPKLADCLGTNWCMARRRH